MSADKRLYEVRVIVREHKIYHVEAEDERDLQEIWDKTKFNGYVPKATIEVSKDRGNQKMIRNKENVK
jgi:hypothetical protein